MKQFLLILAMVALVGCGGDPNEKANELFVEVVKLISSAKEKTGEAAIKDYEQGLANIQIIIADYSESDLAVKLISNETLFTGKSLQEIEERVKELKVEQAAKAEKKRLAEEARRLGFENTILHKAIRKELKKPPGYEVTTTDLKRVFYLHLNDNQLTELPKGLENFTQLEGLQLGDNQLTSVTGLEKLTKLELLELENNQLTEVPKGLENLTQLKKLDLMRNPGLTKAQIDELKKPVPKCKIESNPTK